MEYQQRLDRLQKKLRRDKIDVMLVSQPENRRYLSGYSAPDHGIAESSGMLFVPARGETLLLTDFRFELQAKQETELEVSRYKKGLLPLLEHLLKTYSVRRFAFESHYTLHSFSLKLKELGERLNVKLVPLQGVVEKMRLIKSEPEIAFIRQAVALNEQVFQQIYQGLTPDTTEAGLAVDIESVMRRLGADGPSFPTIVASGRNAAQPHAVPTQRVVGKNRALTIDMGLVLSGYCSDMTRNFVTGPASSKYLQIHRLVRRAQKAGIAAVRPGKTMKEVDRAARKVIADAGYGKYFGHSLGHGVGLAVHEAPSVSPRSRQKLKPGMVITIEPGIYLPGWGGVRLENMVVVRSDGAEVLNSDQTWLDI